MALKDLSAAYLAKRKVKVGEASRHFSNAGTVARVSRDHSLESEREITVNTIQAIQVCVWCACNIQWNLKKHYLAYNSQITFKYIHIITSTSPNMDSYTPSNPFMT